MPVAEIHAAEIRRLDLDFSLQEIAKVASSWHKSY
jgi:hypothetical protein